MTRWTRDFPRRAPTHLPRRLRLSMVEITLAVALTLAAMVQLATSLSSRERHSASADPGGYIRPAAN